MLQFIHKNNPAMRHTVTQLLIHPDTDMETLTHNTVTTERDRETIFVQLAFKMMTWQKYSRKK